MLRCLALCSLRAVQSRVAKTTYPNWAFPADEHVKLMIHKTMPFGHTFCGLFLTVAHPAEGLRMPWAPKKRGYQLKALRRELSNWLIQADSTPILIPIHHPIAPLDSKECASQRVHAYLLHLDARQSHGPEGTSAGPCSAGTPDVNAHVHEACMHAHTHTPYIYKYMHIYIYIRTCLHGYIHSFTHTYVHRHIDTYTHT